MYAELDARSKAALPVLELRPALAARRAGRRGQPRHGREAQRPEGRRRQRPDDRAHAVLRHAARHTTVPVHTEGDHAAITWTPRMRLPGLRKGEAVQRRTLQQPTRATVFGADGLPMAENPATADLAKGLDASTTTASAARRALSCASATA